MSAKNFKILKKEYQAGIHSFTTIGNGATNTPLDTIIQQPPLEVFTIKGSNLGLGTSNPIVSLDTNRKDAYKLPSGTITERPTGVQGYIRYNTESQQFEGFGAGNQWGSLGGVKSVAGDTYILAEYTAGNDDKALHFYTSNIEWMTLTSNGNLGIGTTQPRQRLDITNGSAIIESNVGIGTTLPRQRLDITNGSAIIANNLGIGTTLPQYSLHTEGTSGLLGGSKIVIQNGQDGGSSKGIYYWLASDTNWGSYLAQSGATKSLADGTATAGAGFSSWAIRQRSGSLDTTGFIWENNNEQLLASIRGSDGLSYFAGNTGIGSSSPAFKLDVAGNAYISGPLTVNDTITAPVFSGTATQVSQNLTRGTYLTGNNYNGSTATEWAVDATTTATANKIVARDEYGNIYAANIGIGTTTPVVSLEIWSSNAILLPKGTNASRPTGVQGYIRYNTESQQFEGFGAGNQWGSLGGVKSVAGDTYILAEYSAGNDDKALHFYTSNVEQMILNAYGNLGIGTLTPLRPLHVEEGALFMNGNVGIGTTIPRYTLDVNGDLNVPKIFTTDLSLSNLTVTGSYFIQNDSQSIRNTLQITPLRITQQTTNSSTSNFKGVITGLYKAEPQTTEVYVNGYKMAYYSSSNKDYDVSYTLNNVAFESTFSVTLEETPAYGDIVDIIVWPQYLDPNGMLQPGYVLQNINYSFWRQYQNGCNLYYTDGNVGIGTQTTDIYKLKVQGATYLQTATASNANIDAILTVSDKIGIQTSLPLTSLDIRSTDAILLPRGTSAQRPSGLQGYIRYNTETTQFEGLGAADQWGSLGGVKSTDQQTYISAELTPGGNDGNLRFYNQNNLNMILNTQGNLGIGTNNPTEKLHVVGNILTTGTLTASNINVIGDFVTMNTVTSNTEQIVVTNEGTGPALKVTQTGNNSVAEFYDNETGVAMVIANNGNIGIGTTVGRQKLDIQGGHIIVSGNLGIGNTNPSVALSIGSGGADITSTLMFNSGDAATNTDKLYWTYIKTGSRIGHSAGWNVNHYAGQDGQPAAISNGNFHFFTGASPSSIERFTILNNGNIGIGSTQPVYRLDVAGNASFNGAITTNNNNINAGTGTITAASFSGTATQVSQILTRGNYLTGNNYNGSVATEWAVDASSTNTANKVVVRDASGNFSAGIITASLTGTATQVSQNLTRGTYLTGNNYNGSVATEWAVDATTTLDANKIVARDEYGNIYAANIGIGTTVARQKIDIQDGNAILSGNLGIGTTIPIAALDTNRVRIYNNNSYGRITVARNDGNHNLFIEGTGTGSAASLRLRNSGGATRTAYEMYDTHRWYVNQDTTERMRLDANGNLGIGTNNPTHKLHIYSASTSDNDYESSGILLENATAGEIAIAFRNSNLAANGNIWFMGLNSNSNRFDIGYGNQNSQLADEYVDICIDINGNIGIGTTLSQNKLHVEGTSYLNGIITTNNNNINAGSGTVTAATFSGTATQVSQNLTRGTYLTGNNYNGSVATEWAVDATTTATANKVVVRDQYGNIYAANIGIGTTTPIVALEVWSSNAVLLPKGTNASRPTGVQGYIRYNTESQQFEGFGAGNQWGSLGGVKSVAGDTYILAEYTAGNDDKALHFYTANTEQMILNTFGNLGIGTLTPLRPLHVEEGALFVNGNVGMGTTMPRYTLDVFGDLQASKIYTDNMSLSNLTVTGSYFLANDNQTIRNTLQITPVRITSKVANSSTSNFSGTVSGLYKALPETTEVYVNGYKMAYSSSNTKDYDVSYTLNSIAIESTFNVTLEETPAYGDIIDIIIWPQYLDPNGLLQPGYVAQYIDISYWDINILGPGSSNIYYTSGNVGIGTSAPREKLDIIGNSIITGNVGIGVLQPSEKLVVQGNTQIGKGLSGIYNQFDGGPFFKQSGWDATGTSHIIAFPDYCIAENSAGTLNIQVKSTTTNKLGNSTVSFLNASSANVELFNTVYHKTANLITFTITASTNDIIVSTDSDCSIAWTSIGSC